MLELIHMRERLEEHRKCLKKKDEIAVKKAIRRLQCQTRKDKFFTRKLFDVYAEYKVKIPNIVEVLKEYVDNPVVEQILGAKFNLVQMYDVLYDTTFVGMLMCNNLFYRVFNLGSESSGQLKLRVYISILNYAKYARK